MDFQDATDFQVDYGVSERNRVCPLGLLNPFRLAKTDRDHSYSQDDKSGAAGDWRWGDAEEKPLLFPARRAFVLLLNVRFRIITLEKKKKKFRFMDTMTRLLQ